MSKKIIIIVSIIFVALFIGGFYYGLNMMNKINKKIKTTSFMREMYVLVPGKGNNRINAAYAFGGPKLGIKTLNTNFDTNDIEQYRLSVDKKYNGQKIHGMDVFVSNIEENKSILQKFIYN